MVVVGFGYEIGGLLDIIFGVGHSDAEGGSLKHGYIVGLISGRYGAGYLTGNRVFVWRNPCRRSREKFQDIGRWSIEGLLPL